jgi:DNA modification methylase
MTGKSSSISRTDLSKVDRLYNLDVKNWTNAYPPIDDSSIALVAFAPDYAANRTDWVPALQNALEQSCRVLVPGGHLAVICTGLGQSPFVRVHHQIAEMIEQLEGMTLKGEIIWSKVPFYGGPSYLYGTWCEPRAPGIVGAHETIYVARKQGKREYSGLQPFFDDKIPPERFRELTQSVWRYGADSVNRKYHPNCLPVSLCKALVELFTWPGEVVLDPYCGIGSIPLAAAELGRHFIGMDIEQKYLTIAEQRVYPYIRGREWSVSNE